MNTPLALTAPLAPATLAPDAATRRWYDAIERDQIGDWLALPLADALALAPDCLDLGLPVQHRARVLVLISLHMHPAALSWLVCFAWDGPEDTRALAAVAYARASRRFQIAQAVAALAR